MLAVMVSAMGEHDYEKLAWSSLNASDGDDHRMEWRLKLVAEAQVYATLAVARELRLAREQWMLERSVWWRQ